MGYIDFKGSRNCPVSSSPFRTSLGVWDSCRQVYASSLCVAVLASFGCCGDTLTKGIVTSASWLRMDLKNNDYVLTVKCW